MHVIEEREAYFSAISARILSNEVRPSHRPWAPCLTVYSALHRHDHVSASVLENPSNSDLCLEQGELAGAFPLSQDTTACYNNIGYLENNSFRRYVSSLRKSVSLTWSRTMVSPFLTGTT
jgi:hypothetical protein